MSDVPDVDDLKAEQEELIGESGDSPKVDKAAGKRLAELDDGNAQGHIAVSQGLHIGQEENLIHVYVWTEHQDDVRMGDYMQVPVGGDEEEAYLFGSVKAINYATDQITIDDLDDFALAGGGGIDRERYPMIAVLDPITILHEDENEAKDIGRRAVDTLPHPFSQMYPVEESDHIYRGLNLPVTGASIGYVSVGGQRVTDSTDGNIVYNLLNPEPGSAREPAIFRHMLVAGATGKGKTQMSKNVIRQFAGGGAESPKYALEDANGNQVNKEPCTVIIDPENEYSQIAKDNPELTDEQEAKLTQYEEEGFRVGGVDDCVAFVADVRGAGDVKTDADSTYEFSIPFQVVQDSIQLLMPFEAGEPTYNAISTLVRDYFGQLDKPEDGEYRDFIDWVESRRDVYVDGGSIHESSWDAMMNRIKHKAFYDVFDRGSSPITGDIQAEMFKDGRVSVIPTDHLRDEAESLIVMTILEYIVENKLKTNEPSPEVKYTPIILCVDEAHNYLSDRSNTQKAYIIRKFVKAAKQGRKEKLGLYMVTQNPLDIDEEIRHQTNTKMFLGLEAATVRKIEAPHGFEDRIPVFGRGQAVIKAPDVQPVELQGLPICLTKHSS